MAGSTVISSTCGQANRGDLARVAAAALTNHRRFVALNDADTD
jgi:hypothetical protein